MRTLRALTASAALVLAVSGVRAQDAPKPATPAAAAPAPAVWEFPKEMSAAGRKVMLGEPSVLSRDAAARKVTLRFPVQVLDGAGRLTWGMTEATGSPRFDLSSRLVLVDGIVAGASVLPQLAEKDRDEISKALPDALPKELILRLELLTAAPSPPAAEPAAPPKLSMSAPEILVRRSPAILVQIDGEMVKGPLGDFPFEYVLNTAADLFRDPKSDTWYLLSDGAWLESKGLAGPWKVMPQPPILFSQLPVSHPRGHIRLFVPGTPEYAQRNGTKKPVLPTAAPEVIVRDKPAELVLLRGDPLFTMVPGVKLLVVANTESDLAYHPKSAAYFLCVSGRWFTSEDVLGPWKEAFGSLPEELAKIPRDHLLGHLAWCVPGTPEAAEALNLASIEEEVTIQKGTSITIQYEGKEPKTVPIEGAAAKFATNSDEDVFVAEGEGWACARGVWFRSDDARSNWNVATKIPAVLAGVTESSGLWHTRFCKPLGAAESGGRFAASAGYQGVFAWKGSPVHGTGHTRRGVLRDGNWYPYPRTWGEQRWYDPIAGVFQPRSVKYGPDMKAVADEWSPWTASYGRVRQFADRLGQGGRRMFTFTLDTTRFDNAAGRPDPWGSWGTQVKEREGVLAGRFPLGDRSAETSSKESPVVADEKGAAWREGAKGFETWNGTAWVAADGCDEPSKAWLATLARLRARPDLLRAWAEKRRAPLPVNPTITK